MRILKKTISLRASFLAVTFVAVAFGVVLFALNRYRLHQAQSSGWEIDKTENGLRVQMGGQEFLKVMQARLSTLPDITELHACGRLSDEEWDFIFSQKELVSLSFESSVLTPARLQQMGKLPFLKELNIRSTFLGDPHFQVLGTLSQLEALELNDWEGGPDDWTFTGAGLQEIAKLPKLRELNIARKCFADFESLQEIPNLKSVILQKSTVTSQDFEILAKCRRLKSCDLRTSEIGSADLLLFIEARPDVTVLYDENLVHEQFVDNSHVVPQQIELFDEESLPLPFEIDLPEIDFEPSPNPY